MKIIMHRYSGQLIVVNDEMISHLIKMILTGNKQPFTYIGKL